MTDSKEALIRCPKCSSEHDQRAFLKHYRRIHGGIPDGFENEKRYTCEMCSEEFISPAGYYQHKSEKHSAGLKNLPQILLCHFCNNGMDYKTPGMLMLHYRR